MHESLLAQATLPAPVRVFGVELRPYSLGHELFLHREQSPFVIGGDVLSGDLFEAFWICSSTYRSLVRARNSLLYLPTLWLLRRRARKYDHKAELAAFNEYRDSGRLTFPLSEIQRPNDDRKPMRIPGAPFILRLHHFLCTHYRLSHDAAWDFPYGEAQMRWATHWEQEGGLDIYSELDAEVERDRRERLEPLMAQKLAQKGRR